MYTYEEVRLEVVDRVGSISCHSKAVYAILQEAIAI